jgi:hypothetical protein
MATIVVPSDVNGIEIKLEVSMGSLLRWNKEYGFTLSDVGSFCNNIMNAETESVYEFLKNFIKTASGDKAGDELVDLCFTKVGLGAIRMLIVEEVGKLLSGQELTLELIRQMKEEEQKIIQKVKQGLTAEEPVKAGKKG